MHHVLKISVHYQYEIYKNQLIFLGALFHHELGSISNSYNQLEQVWYNADSALKQNIRKLLQTSKFQKEFLNAKPQNAMFFSEILDKFDKKFKEARNKTLDEPISVVAAKILQSADMDDFVRGNIELLIAA